MNFHLRINNTPTASSSSFGGGGGGGSGGFTLIEVMISLVILTFISLGIYQATTSAYQLRESLSTEGEFYNRVRLAMGIVERDVEQTYSPSVILPSPVPGAPATAPPTDIADLQRDSDYWNGTTNAAGIRASRFLGTDNKLTFISASHFRMYKDSRETEFAKISYALEPDKTNKEHPESMVLVKTEDTDVFNLDEGRSPSMVHSYPLLGGITKLGFKYYRKDKDQWSDSWDNQKPDFKDRYPDIVKVSLEVIGHKKMTFSGLYQFRPETPLNGPMDVTY